MVTTADPSARRASRRSARLAATSASVHAPGSLHAVVALYEQADDDGAHLYGRSHSADLVVEPWDFAGRFTSAM